MTIIMVVSAISVYGGCQVFFYLTSCSYFNGKRQVPVHDGNWKKKPLQVFFKSLFLYVSDYNYGSNVFYN